MRRPLLLLVLALAITLMTGLATGEAAKKKKKKSKIGGIVDVSKVVAAPVPDATATMDGALISTIDVAGKQFKGTRIRDVNVTVQTTGVTANDATGDLAMRLTAPNGGTSWLFGTAALIGQSAGPLTFDDETPNILALGSMGTPADPTEVGPPYIGTVQPDTFSSFGPALLAIMDNGTVTGTWTLRVYDTDDNPVATSVFNSWRLVVIAGRPFRTK